MLLEIGNSFLQSVETEVLHSFSRDFLGSFLADLADGFSPFLTEVVYFCFVVAKCHFGGSSNSIFEDLLVGLSSLFWQVWVVTTRIMRIVFQLKRDEREGCSSVDERRMFFSRWKKNDGQMARSSHIQDSSSSISFFLISFSRVSKFWTSFHFSLIPHF